MSKTKIEWTDDSSNNVIGCTHKSPGCLHCYAEVMGNRLKAMGNPKYANGFKLTLHPKVINEPLKWKKPRMIFMNSMSDTLHKDVPTYYICDVFDMMNKASHHIFQVLTKRAERLVELSSSIPWPKNIWMGVSVESSAYIYRIDLLRKTPAHIKFLSLEPLLGPIPNLNLDGIDWVIVGGESGSKGRLMKKEWVTEIRDQCLEAGVPFFFKQWGTWGSDGFRRSKKANGRMLEGRIWDQMPDHALIG